MNAPESKSSRLSKLAGQTATALLGLAGLAVFGLFGVQHVDYIPDNAIVWVDESNTYYSPPLLWKDPRPFHIPLPVEEVRTRGFRHVSHQPASDREWEDVATAFKLVWVFNKDKTWTEFRPRTGKCVIAGVEKWEIKGKKEYSPDQDHVNAGGFYGNSSSLLSYLLGLSQSRWRPDGSWKW